MHRHLLRELLLVTAVLASISTTARAGSRPELDASALSTPLRAAAERLTRISADAALRRVATLAEGDYGAGRHTATWRSGGEAGSPAAGVYFARMTAGEKSITQRVVVVR